MCIKPICRLSLDLAPVSTSSTRVAFTLEVLRSDWPALLERWKQWAALLSSNSIHTEISYKDTKGNPYVLQNNKM